MVCPFVIPPTPPQTRAWSQTLSVDLLVYLSVPFSSLLFPSLPCSALLFSSLLFSSLFSLFPVLFLDHFSYEMIYPGRILAATFAVFLEQRTPLWEANGLISISSSRSAFSLHSYPPLCLASLEMLSTAQGTGTLSLHRTERRTPQVPPSTPKPVESGTRDC